MNRLIGGDLPKSILKCRRTIVTDFALHKSSKQIAFSAAIVFGILIKNKTPGSIESLNYKLHVFLYKTACLKIFGTFLKLPIYFVDNLYSYIYNLDSSNDYMNLLNTIAYHQSGRIF